MTIRPASARGSRWGVSTLAALLVVLLIGCAPSPSQGASRSATRDGQLRRPVVDSPRPTTPPAVTTTTMLDGGQPVGVTGSFAQVFGDEFNGSSLGSAWYPNRWFATECSTGAGSTEEQIYTTRPENISVSGGNLHLTARREQYACGEWQTSRPFTSGWVQTGGSRDRGGLDAEPGFTCTVGCYAEARIKMPEGGVTFPAFWLMPVETSASGRVYPSRPEIDAVEFYDTWSDWKHHVHFACDAGNVDLGRTYRGPDSTDGFHTIGIWWKSPTELQWYVDGVQTWSYTGCGVPSADSRMYLILNHAIGNAAPSPSPTEPFPKDMLVDYVRVWSS